MPPRPLPLKKRTLPYALPPQRATADTRQTEGRLPAEGEKKKFGRQVEEGEIEEGEIREGDVEEGEIRFNWQRKQGQHGGTDHTHAKGQSHPPTLPQQGHQGSQLAPSSPKHKVFVGGLPHGLGFESLHAYFSQFGAVTDAIVMRKGDGTPRGFGFVTFSSPRVYQQVLAQPEHTIHGKKVGTRAYKPEDGKDQASRQRPSSARSVGVKRSRSRSRSRSPSLTPKRHARPDPAQSERSYERAERCTRQEDSPGLAEAVVGSTAALPPHLPSRSSLLRPLPSLPLTRPRNGLTSVEPFEAMEERVACLTGSDNTHRGPGAAAAPRTSPSRSSNQIQRRQALCRPQPIA